MQVNHVNGQFVRNYTVKSLEILGSIWHLNFGSETCTYIRSVGEKICVKAIYSLPVGVKVVYTYRCGYCNKL